MFPSTNNKNPGPPSYNSLNDSSSSTIVSANGQVRTVSPNHLAGAKYRPTLFSPSKNRMSMISGMSDHSKIRINDRGGIYISPEEIQAGFSMLDEDRDGKISLNQFRKKISILYPELTMKDYKFLFNDQKEMNVDDIMQLLLDNDITHFDPVMEAYRLLDSTNKGCVDIDRFREVFQVYGFSDLDEKEFDMLLRVADYDNDGIISLDDFRKLSDGIKREPTTPSTKPPSRSVSRSMSRVSSLSRSKSNLNLPSATKNGR